MVYLIRIELGTKIQVLGKWYTVIDIDLSPKGRLTLLGDDGDKYNPQVSIGTEVGAAINVASGPHKEWIDFIN